MTKAASVIYPGMLLLVFVPLFLILLRQPTVIDHAEAFDAAVSREMFERGDPVIPTSNGAEYFSRAPLLYWTQMLGYELFGITSLGARAGTAAAGLLTLLVCYFSAAGPLGRPLAFNAALVLGSSLVFIASSRVATASIFPTLFLTLTLVCLWAAVERHLKRGGGAPLFWAGWFWAGLAMLSGGAAAALVPLVALPIYLTTIGRPLLIFQLRWLLPAAVITLIVGYCWYLLIAIFHPDGFHFSRDLFIAHHLGDSAGAAAERPFFAVLVFLFIGFIPWSGYLFPASIPRRKSETPAPARRYLRLFVIGSLTVVALALFRVGSIGHLLPALPGFALLVGRLFSAAEIRRPLVWRLAGWAAAVPLALGAAGLALIPPLFPYLAELLGETAFQAPILFEPVEFGAAPYLAAAALLLAAVLIIGAGRKAKVSGLFETLVLAALITGCVFCFLVLPLYDRLMGAPLGRLAEDAASLTPPGGRIVLHEISGRPSVNFISGRPTVASGESEPGRLPALFDEPDIEVGLTTVYFFERLRGHLPGTVEISRDGGYVLFRLAADSDDASPPDTARSHSGEAG